MTKLEPRLTNGAGSPAPRAGSGSHLTGYEMRTASGSQFSSH